VNDFPDEAFQVSLHQMQERVRDLSFHQWEEQNSKEIEEKPFGNCQKKKLFNFEAKEGHYICSKGYHMIINEEKRRKQRSNNKKQVSNDSPH
jgi:hypothetical protein